MWKAELSVELFSRPRSWGPSNRTCPVLRARLGSDQEMEDVSLAEQRFLGAMAGCRGPGGTHGPPASCECCWDGPWAWLLGGTTCGQIHEFRGKGEGTETSPERQLLRLLRNPLSVTLCPGCCVVRAP
uniref:Uncharacterized protein n=1 Tax=Nomascus leucogenys TaxID=61853 RepID=A0A2I3FSP1_NOMLE